MQHDYNEKALQEHRRLQGKIEITSKAPVKDAEALSTYYTPGVAAVSTYLSQHPDETRNYTMKGNTVAVISDGSAVLGLGNIGPEGAMPVMEGKAMLFKELAGVNAVPLVLATQDPEEIIKIVTALAPNFGGINLEDIAAPNCFEIERRLIEALDIPVMHDDQHGTAIVVLAGLINAAKVTNRELKSARVVIVGSGAAGNAVAKLLVAYGIDDIVMVDSKGIVSKNRTDLDGPKQELAKLTNNQSRTGDLAAAIHGADIFIGVSRAGLLTAEMVETMAPQSIIFALANPTPEIMPDVAKSAGAAVVATGRSDFPNQVNNALGFPGIFKGALEGNVRRISTELKLAAARALAGVVENTTADLVIPSPFDPLVVEVVSNAIKGSGKP